MSRDGSPVRREELDELLRTYESVRGQSGVRVEGTDARGHCALIDGHLGGNLDHAGAGWCASVGQVYSPGPTPSTPLAKVDGQFAAVRYDDAADVVEIFNDPFASQAFYAAERDGRVYASTSATVLARHLGAATDPVGAATFLLAGRQFGPVTHWEGVRRLDPATVLRISSSGMAESTYWRPEVDERVRGMSFNETANHCARTVLSTIEAKLLGEPCMHADITGGLDSRLITAALVRLGIPFTAQTSGEWENEDVQLGREVARVGGFGWRHDRISDDWRPDGDAVREAVAWSDGTLEALQLTEVFQTQRERAATCQLVVTGGAVEHFGPQPWMQEFFRAGRSREVNYDNLMSMRSLTPIDFGVLRESPRPQVERYMRDVLARYASPYATELNTTQLDAIYLYRAVGHFGAYRSASEAYVRTEIPAYYKEIFNSAFSAHYRHRNGHKLHRAIIEKINPAMSAVPTTRGGPAQTMRLRNARHFWPYYWRIANKAAHKISRRPSAHHTEGPAAAGYRHAIRSLRDEGLLDPRSMRTGDMYDTAQLEGLLTASQRPDFDGWTVLGRVATVELALIAAGTQ